MAFSALNIPQSNYNTNFIPLSDPGTHPHLRPHLGGEIPHFQPHYEAERQSEGTSTNHPPFRESGRLGNKEVVPAPVDNGASERPKGVTTTAFSPFPDVGEKRGPYLSDEDSETATGSEGDETFITQHRRKYDDSSGLSQSPLLLRQVVSSSDPLETSLESHSRYSSLSERQQFQHQTREFPLAMEPRLDQNNQHVDLQRSNAGKDLESSGRFTSASATPESQQKVLVTDQRRQRLDSRGAADEEEQSEREMLSEPGEELSENEVSQSQQKGTVASLHGHSAVDSEPTDSEANSLVESDGKISADEKERDETFTRSESISTSTIRQDEVMVAEAVSSEQDVHPTVEDNGVVGGGALKSEGDPNDSDKDNIDKTVFQVT